MIDAGRYSKESRKEIASAINEWVKARTLELQQGKREALFRLLRQEEVEYIKSFY